jgi:hypothetical protein
MSVFGCFLRALAGQALQCMVVAMVFNAWVRLWQEQHQVSCGFAEVILWTVFCLRRFSGIAGVGEDVERLQQKGRGRPQKQQKGRRRPPKKRQTAQGLEPK